MLHRTIRELSKLASVMATFGCAASRAPTSAFRDRSAPSATPHPVPKVAPAPPQVASVKPTTPPPKAGVEPAVRVEPECSGDMLRLSDLREQEMCLVQDDNMRLSGEASTLVEFVSQTLSVAPGARLEFLAQVKNVAAKPVVVEFGVRGGLSSAISYKLTGRGIDVSIGKCTRVTGERIFTYRVEIPVGGSVALDGEFWANDGGVDPDESPCRTAPLPVGSYELEVLLVVNQEFMTQKLPLQVRR